MMFWLVDLADLDFVGLLDQIFQYLNLKLSQAFMRQK